MEPSPLPGDRAPDDPPTTPAVAIWAAATPEAEAVNGECGKRSGAILNVLYTLSPYHAAFCIRLCHILECVCVCFLFGVHSLRLKIGILGALMRVHIQTYTHTHLCIIRFPLNRFMLLQLSYTISRFELQGLVSSG